MAKGKNPDPPCFKKKWKGSCQGCNIIWNLVPEVECPLHPGFFRLIKYPAPKKVSRKEFKKQEKRGGCWIITHKGPSKEGMEEIRLGGRIWMIVRKGESWYLGKDWEGCKTYLVWD